jgi:flagellar biogenesis protein FliO
MKTSVCRSQKFAAEVTRTILLVLLLALVAFGSGETAAESAAIGAPERESIPFKAEPDGSGATLARVAGALALSLLLVFLAAWLLRRYAFSGGRAPGTAGGRISLRSARRITPQITVLLVAVDDREYLLMQTRNGTQIIEHTGRPEGPGAPEEAE